MSKAEAKLNGIEYYRDPNKRSYGCNGALIYKVPCAMCGEIVLLRRYGINTVTYCDYCRHTKHKKEKIILQEELDRLNQIKTPNEKRFAQAVEKIRNQVKNFEQYEKAINIAKTRCERYGSIPEAMVAIELIRLGRSIIPQQKVDKYKVDFAIPKEKLIIEVDGTLYHQNIYKSQREGTIQLALGFDWKIIHIPAELIEKDIKKLEVILNKCSQAA